MAERDFGAGEQRFTHALNSPVGTGPAATGEQKALISRATAQPDASARDHAMPVVDGKRGRTPAPGIQQGMLVARTGAVDAVEKDRIQDLIRNGRLNGNPTTVIASSGLGSFGSLDLGKVSNALDEILPEGSRVKKHSFATGVNIAIVNFGIPRRFRRQEVKRLGDEMKRVADEEGEPGVGFGFSLGGVLLLDAWLENPDELRGLVTAGSPHKVPFVGTTTRPAQGELHTINGSLDMVVPSWLATHPKEDSSTQVRADHFGLIFNKQSITTIQKKVMQIYSSGSQTEKR